MPARHSGIIEFDIDFVATTKYQTRVQGNELRWFLLIKDGPDRLRDVAYCWRLFATNAKGQDDWADVDLVARPKRGTPGNAVSVHGRAAPAPEVLDKPSLAFMRYSTMTS